MATETRPALCPSSYWDPTSTRATQADIYSNSDKEDNHSTVGTQRPGTHYGSLHPGTSTPHSQGPHNRRDSVYDLADTVPTKEYILLSKRLDESNAEATSLKSSLLTANQKIEDLERRNQGFHVERADREKKVDDITLNSARHRRERDFCKSDLHTSKMENSKLQAQSDILRSIVTKFSSAYVEARAGQLAAEEALSQAQSTTRRSCFEKAKMEVQTLISKF